MLDERLQEKRKQVDQLDQQIVGLLVERSRLIDQIGKLKPIAYDPEREANVLANVARVATENGLDADFVQNLYINIIGYFRAQQEGK